jgi:hypothetical protein
MCKAAHPSDGMGSSNPCRWRGKRLHHGGGVCLVFAFCAVSSGRRHSSYLDEYERYVDKYERITLR